MIRALAVKELREVAGIAAIALGTYLMLVSSLIGREVFAWVPVMLDLSNEVPFAGSTFTMAFGIVSSLFAIALGFRQSAWEAGRGTYQFLLHRPVRRNVIFLTKLGTGIGLLLTCASVPILLYAWWAATPGHHPSPFEWSMTGQAWRRWLVIPLVYLGAFLSGLRPARWFGTRLLPLIATLLLTEYLIFIPCWWSLGLPVTIVLYGVCTANICYVARERNYS